MHGFFERDDGAVAEVAFGGADVVVVGRSHLTGDKAGHRGFAFQAQGAVDPFQDAAGQAGFGGADVAADRRAAQAAQHLIDPLPQAHRRAVADKIGFAGLGTGWTQVLGGAQMGFHGIVDVGDVDQVVAGANFTQAAFVGHHNDSGQDVRIARAPDEVGAQRNSRKALLSVGPFNHLFGGRFGFGIVVEKVLGIGLALVGPQAVFAVKGGAGRAGVDQPLHSVGLATFYDVFGALDVRFPIFGEGAPDAGLGGHVKDLLDALTGLKHAVAVFQGAALHFYPQCLPVGQRASRQGAQLMTLGQQPMCQGSAEKSPHAGDENLHSSLTSFCFSAHSPKASRSILALWRGSTGKSRWKRTVLTSA